MINWLAKLVIKTVGIFIKGPRPLFPLMLPSGRQVEVAELQDTKINFPHLRNLDRMIRNLPDPQDGNRITLVGQGFCGDVVARDGAWHLDKGFRFKVKKSWTNQQH